MYWVPTSIQLWRICIKAYLLLISKVCTDCAKLQYSEQLWTETTSIALNYRVNCRRSTLSRLNRVQLTLVSTQPRCWADEFSHVCRMYVFLCLSCPVCIGRPVCIRLSVLCIGGVRLGPMGSDWVISHTRSRADSTPLPPPHRPIGHHTPAASPTRLVGGTADGSVAVIPRIMYMCDISVKQIRLRPVKKMSIVVSINFSHLTWKLVSWRSLWHYAELRINRLIIFPEYAYKNEFYWTKNYIPKTA